MPRRDRGWRLRGAAPTPLLLVVLGGVAVLTACGPREHEWTPLLEEASNEFLTTATRRSREHVEQARRLLAEDPAAAEGELAAAEHDLRRLETYYLPLLEARQRALDAYHLFETGQPERTGRELAVIESLLLEIVEASGEPVATAVEPALEIVADARAALGGAPDQVEKLLKILAVRLQEMALKGDLILSPE